MAKYVELSATVNLDLSALIFGNRASTVATNMPQPEQKEKHKEEKETQ